FGVRTESRAQRALDGRQDARTGRDRTGTHRGAARRGAGGREAVVVRGHRTVGDQGQAEAHPGRVGGRRRCGEGGLRPGGRRVQVGVLVPKPPGMKQSGKPSPLVDASSEELPTVVLVDAGALTSGLTRPPNAWCTVLTVVPSDLRWFTQDRNASNRAGSVDSTGSQPAVVVVHMLWKGNIRAPPVFSAV